MVYKLLIGVSLTIFLMQACGYKPKPEASCHFVQNSLQQRVSWNRQVPITLYVHESIPVEFRGALANAMDDWRRILGRELFKIGGVISGTDSPQQDGNSVIYWENTWDNDRQYEQAQTTIHWAGTQIYEADVVVNEKDFNYSDAAQGTPGYVDVESLFVHELGHVVGLAHNDVTGSVMASVLPKGITRRDPGTVDIEALKCEY